MRRIAALAITVTLGWVIVTWPSGISSSTTALALGVALIAAAIVGWLCEFVRLPRITGYLIFGLVCGPSLGNIITVPMARDLQAVNALAIVVIALTAGLRLDVRGASIRRAFGLGSITLLGAWVALGVLFFLTWPWLPVDPSLVGWPRASAAALAATLVAGAAPVVTMAVITEARARGPFSEIATEVAVAMEIALLVLFAVCVGAARVAFAQADPDPAGLAALVVWTMAGSMAFGTLLGALFARYLRYVGREVTVVLLAFCGMLSIFSDRLDFEPLLAGLAAGLVVQRVMPQAAAVLHDAIDSGAMPALVLYFAAAGASMHIEALAIVGVFAVVIAAARMAVLRASVTAAARIVGFDRTDLPLLWRSLVPTAGVTLGLVIAVALEHPGWGGRLQAIVIAVAALSQLIGPIVFRAALVQLREVGGDAPGLVVVSNREPWIHERMDDGTIVAKPTPGGVSVALDALMRERGGVWIAHGAGSADHDVVDERGSVDVPPDAPAYRLRRLWLTPVQEERYYAGFSNSALWPLCHQAHVRPVFRAEDWEAYQEVNRLFAETVAIEAPPESLVFLNDYHLSLVGGYLRALRPRLRTALFWHIPWPDTDRLRMCPWRREILEGLLSNDLLAFQLPRDQRSFLGAAAEELGATVSGDIVYFGDRPVRVVSIPIGADFDRITEILAQDSLQGEMERLQQELALSGKVVGIGVDRLDYTKGIPERIHAIDRVLAADPELAARFTFVQVGVPSRSDVPGYAEIAREIEELITRVNTKYGGVPSQGPIRYVTTPLQLPQLVALYRLADFAIVSSLHDGMNLVAKEFVAARDDLDGVLILSELTGAAQELTEALIINPYDERGFTAAIARAIAMPVWERRRRMHELRRRVAGRDVLAWASEILDCLERRKGQGFLSG